MTIREYKRLCKQAGCGAEFIVSAPSIEEDRAIGLSEPEYCPKHRSLHARSYSRIACHHYEIELTETGEKLVRLIEQQKIAEFQIAEELAGRFFDPWAFPGEGLGPGGLGRFQRPLRAFIENDRYAVQTREFEIAKKGNELLAALEDHQVIVLVGTTGSGKSTYVPWLLLTGGEAGKLSKWARRGPICVTQPRIQATIQVPRYIANSLNGTSLGIGSQIGYSHSKSDEFDRRTRLIFKTDGKLINDIVSGAISNYSIIMIDEAHERSVNIDLILGLLRDQLYLYPHLRVIIASATIDQESFIGFFGGGDKVPYIHSEGRIFGIDKHWWGDPKEDWWKQVNKGQQPTRDQFPQAIGELVRHLCEKMDALPAEGKDKGEGHILAFLPGTREIDQTVSIINAYNLPNVKAMPLYAQRPLDEQDEALSPTEEKHPKTYKMRRVVVSTNVAETSLTVEGVKYVIETGYIKESYWNPITEVAELQTIRHSQKGCQQRWGRAGRVSPGHCYMFYTERQFNETFPSVSTPALARSSLEQVLLTAKAAGVRTDRYKEKTLDFAWMPLADAKDAQRFARELQRAYESLERQGALDKDGDLTRFGLEMRGMPAALDVAKIFTEGELHGLGVEVATLLPFLKLDYGLQGILKWERGWSAYQKLFVRQCHLDLIFGCRDDLELYLKLWILWESRSEKERRAWEDDGVINYKGFQESIEAERRKLLETAMDWRKAEKRRIAIHKIDALRALIAHCLPHEVYIPVEQASGEEMSADARRLQMSQALSWESYWEGTDQYEEYDDEVTFDDSYSGEKRSHINARSGVYCRMEQSSGKLEESALIEIAPTSACFGQTDADLLIACQRRANFRRPARAKVLGMNMIRLERGWLDAIQGSVVQRSLLYASLSRLRNPEDHQLLQNRLFLPWLLPRGCMAQGIVKECDLKRGSTLELLVTAPDNFPVQELQGVQFTLKGWLPHDELSDAERARITQGAEIRVEAVDYGQSRGGEPQVIMRRSHPTQNAFRTFARRFKKWMTIEVEMRQVLEDPLGRSPLFIVREPVSGLDIPMADSDFCGNTHPYAYFGRRFAIGEHFEVEIEDIIEDKDGHTEHVLLSRGKQLLREYARIPHQDMSVVRGQLIVTRVDDQGLYLAIPGTGKGSAYIGFIRRALWPLGIQPKVGDRIDGRLRRQDRHVNMEKMEEHLKSGLPLPEELDLGVDLDIRIPVIYRQFSNTYKVGNIISVAVEKPLDSGGLLVVLTEGLKGIIYESELGLNDQGLLKSAREYPPGEVIDVIITQMQDDKASVRCSIFRKFRFPPDKVERGSVIEARVLMIRDDFQNEDLLRLTCSWDNQYQVQVRATKDEPLEVGQIIQAHIDNVRTYENLLQGTMIADSEDTDE